MAASSLNLVKEEIQVIYTSELIIGLEKMREQGTLCDAVLVCANTEFPVHRAVLCVGSPYFKSMLSQAGTLPSRIELPGVVEPPALNVILTFLYTGSLKDLEDRVNILPSVLKAAEFFQVSIVYDYCWNSAMTNLNVDTFAEIWCLADACTDKKMVPVLITFAVRNLAGIIQTGSFLMLGVGQLRPFLEQLKLRQQSSDLIVRGILSWISSNVADRQRHLAGLFGIVDLRSLSNQYLKTLIREAEVLKAIPEVRDHLVAIAMDRLALEPGHPLQNVKMICFTYDEGGLVEEWQCNLETQTWLPKKVVPLELTYGTVATYLHGYVYFFGGGRDPSAATDAAEIYNIEQGAVVCVGKMDFRRFRPGVAVFQNQLYIVGGANAVGTLHSVERYDPATNTRTQVASTRTPHSCPNVVAVRDTLYVVGSWNCRFVERYSPLTDSWTSITDIPSPVAHIWPSVATCFGHIYVIKNMSEKHFHVFDPINERWSVRPFEMTGEVALRDIWHVVNASDNKPYVFALNRDNQLFFFNCQEGKIDARIGVPYDLNVKRVLTFFVMT